MQERFVSILIEVGLKFHSKDPFQNIHIKIDSRIERPGCSKTFIHDGESYQLMTIDAVYSKHAGKITKFNYMEIFQIESVIFQKVPCTSSMCL
jgi:hypothetical protein